MCIRDSGYEDDYEGSFTSRRSIIYTLSFTAKYYMYGPVTASNVIRRVQVDQYADLPVNAPKREQRYSVTPTPSNVAPASFDPSGKDIKLCSTRISSFSYTHL